MQGSLSFITFLPWALWMMLLQGGTFEDNWWWVFLYPLPLYCPYLLNPVAFLGTIPYYGTPWILRMMNAKLEGGWDVL